MRSETGQSGTLCRAVALEELIARATITVVGCLQVLHSCFLESWTACPSGGDKVASRRAAESVDDKVDFALTAGTDAGFQVVVKKKSSVSVLWRVRANCRLSASAVRPRCVRSVFAGKTHGILTILFL